MRTTEHLRPGLLEYELGKVEQRRDPPVLVEVFLLGDWWPGELHGWATSPNGGSGGLYGLVTGLREYSPGFGAEFCRWVAAEAVRQR